VVGQVGIDMIAGPTELLVIADHTADPARVACDLIAQAEHDEDATSWCVTTSAALAEALPAALERTLATAPRAAIARASLARTGMVIVVPDLAHAVEVANRRAPEHLEIITADARGVSQGIRHAGAIFLGDMTPEPVGDYIAGPSHVLPTSERLAKDATHIVAIAEAERLSGHAEAVRVRMRD
jgi:histidinol dehydrogenase